MAERGSVVPLLAALVGLTVLALIGTVEVGRTAIARAEAQTAADLAALAAVHEGRDGARDLAGRNGAELVTVVHDGGVVHVVVELDGRRAEAWAALDWERWPDPPVTGGSRPDPGAGQGPSPEG